MKSHKSNFLKLEFGWPDHPKIRRLYLADGGWEAVGLYFALCDGMATHGGSLDRKKAVQEYAVIWGLKPAYLDKTIGLLIEIELFDEDEGQISAERVRLRVSELLNFSETQKVRANTRWSAPKGQKPKYPRDTDGMPVVIRGNAGGMPLGIRGNANINKDLVNNTLSTPSPKPLPLLSQDSGTEAVEIGTYLTAKLGRHATPDEMAQEYDRRRLLKRQSLQPKADPDPGPKAERSSLLNIPGMAEAVKAEKRKRQRKPKLSDDDPFGDSFGAS